MTIEEFRAEKKKIELDIMNLLKGFTDKYQVDIDRIDLINASTISERHYLPIIECSFK